MGIWMVSKSVTVVVIFLLFLINISLAVQNNEPKSNLKHLENILESTINELVKQSVLNERDSLSVKVISDDSTFSSIQTSFINNSFLNDYNFSVYSQNENNSLSGKLVIFRWVDWIIKYEKIKRRFWQKQKFQRNLKADFFVEVFNRKDNKILFSKNVKKNEIDTIKNSDFENIQNPKYAFTMGQMLKNDSLLKRWLEPVFLFAISGTVVYLFYSVRSK
jgi:hypothetical protein